MEGARMEQRASHGEFGTAWKKGRRGEVRRPLWAEQLACREQQIAASDWNTASS